MSSNIELKRGLDIPITGKAAPFISKTIVPDIVAIRPGDFKGFVPRLLVSEGDRVLCGSPVLADKIHPEILLTSPISGTVQAIVRGEKRKLLAVLVRSDMEGSCAEFNVSDAKTSEGVRDLLLSSGLWPWIVQRPYGTVANPDARPKAIFVSSFNTAPLAADNEFAFASEIQFIQTGIDALALVAGCPVHLGINGNLKDSAFSAITGVQFHRFKGKHPAGNVGVQISHVCPIRRDETVWTVSLAGLAAIGKLLRNGRLDLYRTVAVTGPMAIEPSYVRTVPGMSISELAGYYGNTPQNVRIISGDPLSGRKCGIDGHLGFFDTQITMINEGTEREWFGWLRPLRYKQFSTDRCYFSWLTPWRKYDMDTNIHGGQRAFVMSDPYYAKVLPMDIFPVYLTKACLAGDIDRMEKFGIYEVLPEDLALCEYIDPCKNEIQDIIAKGIDLMRKEMA